MVGRPDRTLDEVPVVFVNTATDDPAVVDRIAAACARLLSDFKRRIIRNARRQRDVDVDLIDRLIALLVAAVGRPSSTG